MEPASAGAAATILALLPWALWLASEIIAQIPALRENSLLEVVMTAMRAAFPYNRSDTDT
ncbi:MAG: hypothetical protein ACPGSE_00450 [Synechococcus sp.]